MNTLQRKSTLSILLPLAVGMAAISCAPILVRYSGAPVSVQGFYRMLFTFLMMLPFGWKYRHAFRTISMRDWVKLTVAGFFLALHFLLWMASLSYTSIASSTILLTLEPVFVAIGAYLVFKERLRRSAVIGMSVSIAGAILVSSGDFGLSRSAFYGDTLSLLGTVAVAVNMILAKQLMERIPSYVYSLIVFGITALCFAVYNVAGGIPMSGYEPKEWGLFLLLAIIPTVFGHMIFNWLLQSVKATTISMAVLAEPIGASLLGLLLFGELITGFQLIGGVFMIAGFILYLKSEERPSAAKQGDPALDAPSGAVS
ncbi:DMT family transporter [Paenibacillus sp. D51F]